uniref:Reverse transcriptase domain-containing protein n=1 Tax=Setaria italica TaxID=4555 RepID=K4AJC7_SETIT
MYNNVVTRVRTSDGDTDDFPIRIGLHQGSALSPYLFALEMDEEGYISIFGINATTKWGY